MDRNCLFDAGPNVIGATGGSGTRVFARIVRQAGMFIGDNLNESEDAIPFGHYSDRWINQYMPYRDAELPSSLQAPMVQHLDRLIQEHCASIKGAQPWGWKEPRSIYLLPFFYSRFPRLKFLHVVRDGRDMAYSANQNQLRKHGKANLPWPIRLRRRPFQSIALWSRINLWTANYGESKLGSNYLRVRFEDLCSQPESTVRTVLDFFGLAGDAARIAELEVKPPSTLARWRREATAARVTELGRECLARLGYTV